MLIGWKKYLAIFGIFLLGGFLVWLLCPKNKRLEQTCSQDYPFVSPEIDCQTIGEVANQVADLHGNVYDIVRQEKEKGNIIRASVFFRDLNTRRWFGIDDLEEYYPASILKLPLSLAYFKLAELQPEILDQQLTIPAEGQIADNSDQAYPPADPLVPGKTYVIREMIRHTLLYSDNAPFAVMMDSLEKINRKVFQDLGVAIPENGGINENWSVSPRSIANIFRMLYNASYLNLKYANETLDLLSQSTFTKGIVAGVPEGVKVAHKFGEGTAMDSETEVHSRTLNDCGIVYKPGQPYIICIMTEGKDFPALENVIKEISYAAYDAR